MAVLLPGAIALSVLTNACKRLSPTLKDSGLHIFAENGAEDIHDLTEGSIGFDSFDDGRHGVLRALGSTAQLLQAALDSGLVALFPHPVGPLHVRPLAYLVNVERRTPDLLIHTIVV